jgi:hypothetical protein
MLPWCVLSTASSWQQSTSQKIRCQLTSRANFTKQVGCWCVLLKASVSAWWKRMALDVYHMHHAFVGVDPYAMSSQLLSYIFCPFVLTENGVSSSGHQPALQSWQPRMWPCVPHI